jgi:hypothetical protein
MSKLVTQEELLEIVPELQALAVAEPAEKVREALNRLVERYAAMAGGKRRAASTPRLRQPRGCAASVY